MNWTRRKNTVGLVLILCGSLIWSGCADNSQQNSPTTNEQTVLPKASPVATTVTNKDESVNKYGNEEENATANSDDVPVDGLAYEVSGFEEKNKQVKWMLPQVIGSLNEDVKKRINQQLRQALLNMAGLNGEGALDKMDPSNIPDELTFESDFRVHLYADDALSLALTASSYWEGAAYPNNLVRTVTFDLKNGNQVKAADCLTSNDDLIKQIRSYKVPGDALEREVLTEAVRYVNESMDDAALKDKIKSMDTDASAATSYWTKDKLGLNFETIHAIGDFVQLEIPFTQITSALKSESPVCEVLAGKK